MRNSTLKICAMLLAICTSTIHLQAMDEWDGKTIAQGFYSGTGTKSNPYRIFTASQFLYFIQQIKDGNTFSDKYIELCNDIAFSHDAVKGLGYFYGDFDGNEHKIQVNTDGDESYYWNFCGLYGSMHDVQFVNANNLMTIYTGGILYNCRFEFNGYHGSYTISLDGGTIANCVSNSANFKNSYKYGGASGFVSKGSSGNCLNCYFPITSRPYGSDTPAENYYGTVESCGEAAGNDWVQSHTERAYKSWPLTFNPTYSEYQIREQPHTYNPSVVCPNSDEALYQWCYQERKPIIFEDITFSYSTQTKNIVVPDNDVVFSFDFTAHGYTYTGYGDGDDDEAWIRVNGEEIVSVYHKEEGTYSCQASAGSTFEISCECSNIKNIRITYPTETLANENSRVLSKQTIMERPGVYFCQVSYGEDCDVMYSDDVDYEKLFTTDDMTYVINEDATATVLWVADKAVDATIPETVGYNEVNYPVTSISSKAFVDCTSLASIKCKTLEVPALLGGATFEGLTPSNVTLYVSIGREPAYSAAEGWKEIGKILGVEFAIELVDGQTFDNKEDKVVGEIIYTRTFVNKEVWNAVYLPFEIPMSMLKDKYRVAYINDVHSSDKNGDGEVQVEEMWMEVIEITNQNATLRTNHPYLVWAKTDKAKEFKIVLENATLYAADESLSFECSSMYHNYKITGTYRNHTKEELADKLVVSTKGQWVTSTTDMKPFRLCMEVTKRDGTPVKLEISEAKALRIVTYGEATDIDQAEYMDQNTNSIYDLTGRRVDTPQKGGVYIVNGKKVIF